VRIGVGPHKSRGKARIRIKERAATLTKAKLEAKRKWQHGHLAAPPKVKVSQRDEI
jgi:hypothetical protein